MRKKYIYISLLISTGIYAIADYYCIYNFTFTLLFTIFLIFNLVNSVICFAKNRCEFSIIASIIYVFMIMHNLFVLAFNYSISSGGFHTIWGERFEQRTKEKCPIRCLRQIYLISKRSFGTYPKIHNCRISGLGNGSDHGADRRWTACIKSEHRAWRDKSDIPW